MLVYLIKSGACLGILFIFYTIFLERENMHVFKRFYLLASLVIALLIPTLVFTEYVAAPVSAYGLLEPVTTAKDAMQPALEEGILNLTPVLWGIYVIGLLFFGIKFIKNLFQIFKRIRRNPKYRVARFTQVLLLEKIAPHTFFSYIFLNKKKLEANEIPKEVLLHEETHARQKHSFDVVFVELLQVIFWVNPFIYLSKKAIKLNHEFLADQAVLKKDINKITYQNTLLSYLSTNSEKKYQSTMANAINYSSYSSIKKRFTVMKTHTSRKSVLFKSILLIPLLALLLYGFSETKIETIDSQPHLQDSNYLNYYDSIEEFTLRVRITKKGELFIEDQEISLAAAESHVRDLMKAGRLNRALIFPDIDAPKQVIEDVNRMLGQYEIAQISIVGPEDLEVYSNLQKGATDNQIKEYNALAKKYNTMLSKSKSIQIKMKDVERLEYLHSLMSHAQKENAEPFPDFPDPPPPPKAPKSPKVKKGKKSDIPPPPSPPKTPDFEQQEILIEQQEILMEDQKSKMEEQVMLMEEHEIIMEEQVMLMEEHETIMEEQKAELEEIEEQLESDLRTPSPPPTPKSPLDHVIEMAKKDAVFYYEDQEISSDKAIDILKKNKSINIDSRGSNTKRPVVRLSTQPITIDN